MNKTKKILAGVTAGACAIAIALTGTFAWYHVAQKVNDFNDTKKDSELVDKFDPDTGDKNVWVKNTGDCDIYVRIRLDEQYAPGQTTPIKLEAPIESTNGAELDNWKTNVKDAASTDANVFHNGTYENIGATYFKWLHDDGNTANDQGGKTCAVVLMSKVKANDAKATAAANAGCWILDDTNNQGYYYWSKPLPKGQSTGMILDQVKTPAKDSLTYYYGLNVAMETVDYADLGMWFGQTDTATSNPLGYKNVKGDPSVRLDGPLATTQNISELKHNALYDKASADMTDYLGKQADAKLTGLQANTDNLANQEVGKPFNPDGLKIYGVLDDGTKVVIPNDEFTFSPDPVADDGKMTATYKKDPTKTTQFQIPSDKIAGQTTPVSTVSFSSKTASGVINNGAGATETTVTLPSVNVLPTDAADRAIVYSCDNANVSFPNGTEYADPGTAVSPIFKAPGTYTIKVASKADPSKSDTCTVTITNGKIPVTSVSFATANETLTIPFNQTSGTKAVQVPTINPTNASIQTPQYTITGSGTASISGNTITATPGTYTVTATVDGQSASYTLTVTQSADPNVLPINDQNVTLEDQFPDGAPKDVDEFALRTMGIQVYVGNPGSVEFGFSPDLFPESCYAYIPLSLFFGNSVPSGLSVQSITVNGAAAEATIIGTDLVIKSLPTYDYIKDSNVYPSGDKYDGFFDKQGTANITFKAGTATNTATCAVVYEGMK